VRHVLTTLSMVLAATAVLVGCQSSPPAPLPLTAPSPLNTGELSKEELREATRLYSIKCARCHKFYDPADYGDGEWHTWMNKMSRKARLKADQAQLLSRYLETFRTAQRSDGKDGTP